MQRLAAEGVRYLKLPVMHDGQMIGTEGIKRRHAIVCDCVDLASVPFLPGYGELAMLSGKELKDHLAAQDLED